MTAESTMNNTISRRMVRNCLVSFILAHFFFSIKSNVRVELAVSTREERVLMEAASTSTTTSPSSTGEKWRNMVGMMAS